MSVINYGAAAAEKKAVEDKAAAKRKAAEEKAAAEKVAAEAKAAAEAKPRAITEQLPLGAKLFLRSFFICLTIIRPKKWDFMIYSPFLLLARAIACLCIGLGNFEA